MIGAGVFNDIPAQLRIPGVYIEFDNRLAGSAVFMGKLLFLGQKLDTGKKDAHSLDRVTNAEQAERYYGRGSMLAEMIRHAKDVDPYLETWAIPLNDDEAGVKASGVLEITNEPTETRPLALYIAGYRVRVPVEATDTPEDVAEAIVEAIGDEDRMPVTAEVDGTDAYKVNLECRWAGETGNDIDIRISARGEERPEGLKIGISEMSGGAANPEIDDAIAAMGDEWWNWIALPYTDSHNLEQITDELEDRFGPMIQKGGRAFAAYRGTHSETGTFGGDNNSPHLTVMGTNKSPSPTWIWTAVNAITAADSLSNDPARPLQRLSLRGIMPPREEDRWEDYERNLLLYDGIATFTVQDDGTVQIERQITTYQQSPAGVPDDSYLDINIPETLERIRYEQRSLFLRKYPRHKLADDASREFYSPSQPIMTPKVAKAELLRLYKETFMGTRGWVQDYEGYADSLQVNVDPDDPTRLNTIDSPRLIGQYRIHAQQVQFRR
ncbi:phage tail sheath subtilisin-like domain-containing protein [Desulfonatronovibrio hydrogenovorans]|uniref:phage tail sheath subtilisin-like domain-containing protein n=1 Tax=Desulfonatronovibrio hydrogenovorans TaxID=53245 RepID=UPI000491CA5E|nr:phage tail sheath subtilisin-like domain-containing protein [Desulfonatronovibrio hydrogenovorans]